MPFSERATMYPRAAPLRVIFLEKLSGDHIKAHAVDVSASGEKALEGVGIGGAKPSALQGDVESGREWMDNRGRQKDARCRQVLRTAQR